MADQIDICNMALAHCKAKSIIDINGTSTEAIYCNLFYDVALRFLLENTPWKFTCKVSALSLFVEEPTTWIYSYAYPSDCLLIRRILPNIFIASNNANDIIYRDEYYNVHFETLSNYKVPYEVALNSDGAQAIWTNEPDAIIAYTIYQTNTSRYSSSFVMAFSHYLASLIAVPVVGRKEGRLIASDQIQFYNDVINAAIMNNEVEKYSGPRPESDMISVRF